MGAASESVPERDLLNEKLKLGSNSSILPSEARVALFRQAANLQLR